MELSTLIPKLLAPEPMTKASRRLCRKRQRFAALTLRKKHLEAMEAEALGETIPIRPRPRNVAAPGTADAILQAADHLRLACERCAACGRKAPW